MSKRSGSLELSEFFNNDDSNGYRLAEFLQKRRGGGIQSQQFLFAESEPLRLSVDVQFEKLPSIVQNDNDRPKEPGRDVQSPPANVNDDDGKQEGPNDDSKDVQAGVAANSQGNTFKPVSSSLIGLPLSPRLAAIRKSGGISPSDRLRRFSLKRLSKVCYGRRTLLQEFEDTMTGSEFSPHVCSTPLSQEVNGDSAGSLAKPTANVENIEPNISQEYIIPTKSLENKDENIRRMVENILETRLERNRSNNLEDKESEKTVTQQASEVVEQERTSTLRRTYTLEKGQKPGQVILTPETVLSPKSIAMDISGFMQQSQKHDTSQSVMRSTSVRPNCSHVAHKSMSSNRCSLRCENGDVTNITQQCHQCNAGLDERDVNGGDHLYATTHMTDMDITPQVNHTSRNVTLRPKTIEISPHKALRTLGRHENRSQLTISFDNPHIVHSPKDRLEKRSLTSNRSMVMLNMSKCGDGRSSSKINDEVCPTTPPPSISINQLNVSECIDHAKNQSVGEDELVIPETQDPQDQRRRNSIVIESPNHQVPFVIIPVNQTFNNSIQNKSNNPVDHAWVGGSTTGVYDRSLSSSAICAQPKSNLTKSQDHQATVENNLAADYLRLTDILTDDEDEPAQNTMSETNGSKSQVPLNLADVTGNGRVTRLRARNVASRRLQKVASEAMSTESETETLPLSLSTHAPTRKRSNKRRQAPLNKAPGVPLNGEEFAKELARMSNYEILDLRKRNSLGQVFAIRGRNSLWEKDQAVKKQVKLDDEIEMELLRRNMQLANRETINITEAALTETDIEARDIGCEELYPPAPQEFCDTIGLANEKPPGTEEEESSLVDEQSCDRISFVKRREILRKRKKKSVPDVLQHYLEVSKKFSLKKKRKRLSVNISKRSLYTRGSSEPKEMSCDSSSERNCANNTAMTCLPYVPSPPPTESDQMPPLRVVSPPPPLSESLENLQRTRVDRTINQTAIQPTTPPLPPPPVFETTDSGVETNSSSQSVQQTALVVAGNRNSEDVFKKPLPPPPARRKKPERKKSVEHPEGVTLSSEPTMSETSSDTSSEGALRRSKRGHVPLRNKAPLFQILFQKVLNKQFENRERQMVRDKTKLRENSKANIHHNPLAESKSSKATALQKSRKPLAVVPESSVLDLNSQENEPRNSKKKSKKLIPKVTRKTQSSEALECSRISMVTPPPLEHFNNVFDHLRNTSQIYERNSEKENKNVSDSGSKKKLRVRVARIKGPEVPNLAPMNAVQVADAAKSSHNISQCSQKVAPGNSSTVSSTNDTRQSNFELISWLKNVTDAENTSRNDDIFKEMRISSACNLCFTELQGVEYAFYDTDDKASLGYLRFKPRQIKSKKRAKRYHLHFVTLVGNFRITANDKESIVGPGDLVAIEKSIYYDIENISDDIGILMVIKK